jgi:peptide/nickel transport system permease protein
MFFKKLFYSISMMGIISLISFGAILAAPNAFFSGGELNPNMGVEQVAHMKSLYGFDRPWYDQYFSWIHALMQADFGVSFSSGVLVHDLIVERLPVTLLLNGISLCVIFGLSLLVGIYAAAHYKKLEDSVVVNLSLASFSMPSLYLALMLLSLFSVTLGWFPLGGLHSFDAPQMGVGYYVDYGWHLFLPLVVMILTGTGSLLLYVRSLVIEILQSDYIFFAKARGIQGWRLIRWYVLPNLAPSMITMLGLSFPALIGGSVLLESLFGIQGMGLLFYQSALSGDYPVIMGILMITAFLTLLGNIIADLVLLKLNPFTH